MDRKESGSVKRIGKGFVITLIAGMALMLSSCTTYNSFKGTFINKTNDEVEPTITIGVFEPQTGRNEQKGKEELKGIELANSIYNNVDGYKVVLSKVDTQSSVSATETAVSGLIEMKPVALIGSAGEATSLAASAIIEEAKVPTITPSSTNPLITQGNDYYFRASITESQMGQGLAEYAVEELESDKLGILSLKNDSSVAAVIDGFETTVRKLNDGRGSSIVARAEITPNVAKEMQDAVMLFRLKTAKVLFAPLGAEDMDKLFTIIEEKDMTDIVFLGNRSWGDEAFINMMSKHPDIKVVFPYETVLSGTSSTSDAITQEAQRFQIEYANRYGSEDMPTYNAALGYDSYLILINAIHYSKSLEGEDVRNALLNLESLKCSTGEFSFDQNGNVIRSVTLSTIKDSKPVTEYVCEGEAKAAKLEEVEEQQMENEAEEKKKGN